MLKKDTTTSEVDVVATPVNSVIQAEAVTPYMVTEPEQTTPDEKEGLKSTGEELYEQCKAALEQLSDKHRNKKSPSGLTGKVTQMMQNGLFGTKSSFNFEEYKLEEELTIFRGIRHDFNQYEWNNIDKNDTDAVINVITQIIESRVQEARNKRSRLPDSITPEHGMDRYSTLSQKIMLSFTKKVPRLSSLHAEIKRKEFMDNMLKSAEAEGAIPKSQRELKIIEEQVKFAYETVLENLVKEYKTKTETGVNAFLKNFSTKSQWKNFRETEEKDIFKKLYDRFVNEFNVKDYCAGKTTGAQVNQAIFEDIRSAIEVFVGEAKTIREQAHQTHHLGNEDKMGMQRYDTLSNKILKSCMEELKKIGTDKEKAGQLEQKWIERRRLAGEVIEATGEAAVMVATGVGYVFLGVIYVTAAVLAVLVEANDDCHHRPHYHCH